VMRHSVIGDPDGRVEVTFRSQKACRGQQLENDGPLTTHPPERQRLRMR
jgi:hypothetical protein